VIPPAGALKTERGRQAFQGRSAMVRTAFSSERLLLSWIRTSVSFFGFGFAFNKFISYLEGQQGLHFSGGPHQLGIALVCVGVLVLVLAVFEHVRRLRSMVVLGLPTVSWFSLPVSAAVGVLAIGVTVLVELVLRSPS
jgi:uncharacterized membrane protein YidH (DUF202 family)